MIATVENMRRCEQAGLRVVVLDTVTLDAFSATPGDYFMLADDDPILDAEGDPCILARCVPASFEAVNLP